jgi:phosphatidylserine synthase
MTSIPASTPTPARLTAAGGSATLRTIGLAAVVAISVILPFVFLPMEADWAHMAFHLIGIPLCLAGILLLSKVRAGSASRTVRVMTWISTVCFAGWLIGHLGELLVVIGHGGMHAPEEVFENPAHVAFANLAVPSWMATVLSLIVLLVTMGIVALRSRSRS